MLEGNSCLKTAGSRGVSGLRGRCSKREVYSLQAVSGHNSLEPSAGKGTGDLCAGACNVLVQPSDSKIPSLVGQTSALVVWREGSNSLLEFGARFEALRYPRYPNMSAILRGHNANDDDVTLTKLIRCSSVIAGLAVSKFLTVYCNALRERLQACDSKTAEASGIFHNKYRPFTADM